MQTLQEQLPDGRAGTLAKLNRLRSLIEQGKRDPQVRQLAHALLQGVPERDSRREIDALHRGVRAKLRYTQDPVDVEWFTAPGLLAGGVVRGGDCDDHVALLGALLETTGHPVRLVAGGSTPEDFHHVWLQVADGSRWRTLDPIAKRAGLGYDPARHFRTFLRQDPPPMSMTRNPALAGFDLHSFERTVLRPLGKTLRPLAPAIGAGAGLLVPGVGPLIGAAIGAGTGLLTSGLGKGGSATQIADQIGQAAGALGLPGSDLVGPILSSIFGGQSTAQKPAATRPTATWPYGPPAPTGLNPTYLLLGAVAFLGVVLLVKK